jgi:hypothetical protein
MAEEHWLQVYKAAEEKKSSVNSNVWKPSTVISRIAKQPMLSNNLVKNLALPCQINYMSNTLTRQIIKELAEIRKCDAMSLPVCPGKTQK